MTPTELGSHFNLVLLAMENVADAAAMVTLGIDTALRGMVAIGPLDWGTLRINTRRERDVLHDGPWELIVDIRCSTKIDSEQPT